MPRPMPSCGRRQAGWSTWVPSAALTASHLQVNNSGQVVGSSKTAGDVAEHAVLWQVGDKGTIRPDETLDRP